MKKRKIKKSLIPLYLTIGGGLLLITAAILLTSQEVPAAPTTVTSHEEERYSEIQRVSLDDAKAALDAGTAVFVDVRATEAYEAGHVTGAISIPNAEVAARLGELEKTQWIITYCT